MKLDIKGVKAGLKNKLIEDIKYYESVTSTNKVALNMEEENIKEGLVIVGGEQTKGRGRLKRNWHSPKDLGLWFSIILTPKKDPERIPLLTLIGALSVHDAIKNIGIETDLKWPNDILYKNKKLCGVLSQFKSSGNNIERVVVGIGLNVNQKEFPRVIKNDSISLRMIKGEIIDREKILADILNKFAYYYTKFQKGEYISIIEIWKKEMTMLNKKITVNTAKDEQYKGKVVDITENGALIIEQQDKTRKTLIAGDVSIDKKP